MSRPLLATIHLETLRQNYRLARRLHGGRVLAVLKANAYGHGALACAQALHGLADGFAVAAIEEALALREGGVTAPILLLEGWFEASELVLIDQHRLWVVVHHAEQADQLCAANLTAPLNVWLKMDSGMHRLGFAPEDIRPRVAQIQASGRVANMVVMSHFSRADLLADATTPAQVARAQAAVAGLGLPLSLSNSGGILAWPQARTDWGRAGIMLYGGAAVDGPVAGLGVEDYPRPVMQLDSRIMAVRELPMGETVGYGLHYQTTRPTRLGVVACGYADGYPRAAANGTPVLVDGEETRIIGRVSMDMLTVDLTDLPAAGLGSAVRLWGEGLPADRVAQAAGTVSYELFCNVKRARFQYQD